METREHRDETSLKKQLERLEITVELFLYEFEGSRNRSLNLNK